MTAGDTAFMVVRSYRGKSRVIALAKKYADAKAAFDAENIKARDGELHIREVTLGTVHASACYGYNRTRW